MVKCLFCKNRIPNPVDALKPRFAQSYSCNAGQVNNKECQYFTSDEVIDVDFKEIDKINIEVKN